jgi:TonB family protein
MKKYLFTGLLLLLFIAAKAQTTPPPPPPLPPDADAPAKVDTGKRFVAVEQYPEFPGGIAKLIDYINSNLKYPKAAKKASLEGRVIVSFVVERDGSLTEIKVQKSLSPETDAEAIRLITNSPKWVPGMQGGRAVRVMYSMPVKFELNN